MCCGKSRANFRPATFASPAVGPASVEPGGRFKGMAFEYTGRTGLTVTGPVTGRTYRFDRPGAVVEVDPRDRPSIAAIPVLRLSG